MQQTEVITTRRLEVVNHISTATTVIAVVKATAINGSAVDLVRIVMVINLHNDLKPVEYSDKIAKFEVNSLYFLDQNEIAGFITIPDYGFEHFSLAQFSLLAFTPKAWHRIPFSSQVKFSFYFVDPFHPCVLFEKDRQFVTFIV